MLLLLSNLPWTATQRGMCRNVLLEVEEWLWWTAECIVERRSFVAQLLLAVCFHENLIHERTFV